MPKAKLEWDLNEFDERTDHRLALLGKDLYIAILDMDDYFRNRLKHEELSAEVVDELEKAREYLRECVDVRGAGDIWEILS